MFTTRRWKKVRRTSLAHSKLASNVRFSSSRSRSIQWCHVSQSETHRAVIHVSFSSATEGGRHARRSSARTTHAAGPVLVDAVPFDEPKCLAGQSTHVVVSVLGTAHVSRRPSSADVDIATSRQLQSLPSPVAVISGRAEPIQPVCGRSAATESAQVEQEW